MSRFDDGAPPGAIVFAILATMGLIAAICFLIAFWIAAMSGPARGHDDHHRFHAFYQNWINKDGKGCCNDRDCKPAEDRMTDRAVEVKIEGTWCPVHSRHYLKGGNVPDASVAHACVAPLIDGLPASPCARLICYQPKPLF